MKYHAIVRGQEHTVEIAPQEGKYRVVIDGKELLVDAVHLKGFAVSLLASARSVRCDIEPGKDGQLSVLVGDSAPLMATTLRGPTPEPGIPREEPAPCRTVSSGWFS